MDPVQSLTFVVDTAACVVARNLISEHTYASLEFSPALCPNKTTLSYTSKSTSIDNNLHWRILICKCVSKCHLKQISFSKKSTFSVVRISQRPRIYLTWWMNRELEPHLVHLKSRTFVVFLVALVKPSQCVYASTLKRLS